VREVPDIQWRERGINIDDRETLKPTTSIRAIATTDTQPGHDRRKRNYKAYHRYLIVTLAIMPHFTVRIKNDFNG
jgi:hypothetical protein